MIHVDVYRACDTQKKLVESIQKQQTRPWTIMEICGGQTHSIVKNSLHSMLSNIELVHGPGCPVCVAPAEAIDQAVELANKENVILCAFGDILRVPGSGPSLIDARAHGANVQTVFSPLDCIEIAQKNSDKEVVFFAIGFETTIPLNAMLVKVCESKNISNLSLIVAQVTVPPAMRAILSEPEQKIDGFLAAGHVCSIMGYWQYHAICDEFKKPIVVTGFEPVDILYGILKCVESLERGLTVVTNAYQRFVQEAGNKVAQQSIDQVFELCDQNWRGIGPIERSGLRLRQRYGKYCAKSRFQLAEHRAVCHPDCISSEILRGKKRPSDCIKFETECHPGHPLGAPMVSGEGACAAYFKYQRRAK